jgi:hypothetical protein
MISRMAFVCALAGLVLGCSAASTMPKTYTAKGRVVYKDGQPLKSGLVEFHSTSDANLRANGVLDSEGRFTLKTMTDTGARSGVPEGTYNVSVTTGYTADQTQQAAPETFQLKETYTIKPDDMNEFTITLPNNAPKK